MQTPVLKKEIARHFRSVFSTAILFGAAGFLGAQTSRDASAQRQLHNDRERFQREVDRQRSEAKTRETNTRNTLSEVQTSDDIERLRTQQSAQQSSIDSLNRKLTSPAPELARSRELTTSSIQTSDMSPDFAVTFLADGRCVIYRKGRLPEVHTAAEAQAILKALSEQRASSKSTPESGAKTDATP